MGDDLHEKAKRDGRRFSWKRSPSELKYGVDRYIISVDPGSSMAAMST